jgi:hypothetical protein
VPLLVLLLLLLPLLLLLLLLLQAPVVDSLARSAVKGLVWRLFSTTATMGIALLVLHDVLKVSCWPYVIRLSLWAGQATCCTCLPSFVPRQVTLK